MRQLAAAYWRITIPPPLAVPVVPEARPVLGVPEAQTGLASPVVPMDLTVPQARPVLASQVVQAMPATRTGQRQSPGEWIS